MEVWGSKHPTKFDTEGPIAQAYRIGEWDRVGKLKPLQVLEQKASMPTEI